MKLFGDTVLELEAYQQEMYTVETNVNTLRALYHINPPDEEVREERGKEESGRKE